jgi:hypothetical protein
MSFYDLDEALTAFCALAITVTLAIALRAAAAPRSAKAVAVGAWFVATAQYFFVATLPRWAMLPFVAPWLAPVAVVAFYDVSRVARACAGLSVPLMMWLMLNYFGY